MDRAFHNLTVRTIDEGKRLLEGVATSARTDRVGDIVEPLGSEYDLPLPLLLDHNHTLAVGDVEQAEVRPSGIRFQARIKKISTPGKAKDLVDMAWDYARHGLRRCVSIGFQPLEAESLPGGGVRFLRWSWYELSLCSVPANPDCVIDGVKRAPRRPGLQLSADRGKLDQRAVIDMPKHLRAARRALAHFMGESKVPHFPSMEALQRFEQRRLAEAEARGSVMMSYLDLMRAMPPLPAGRVVRLGGR